MDNGIRTTRTPEEQAERKNETTRLWRIRNPEKRSNYSKEWRARNPEKVKAQRKKWRDGIGKEYMVKYLAEYHEKNGEELRYKQSRNRLTKRQTLAGRPMPELCELCDKPETRKLKHWKKVGLLCYDHCHKTGDFRGWLCFRCNSTLGKMEDDMDLMRKMISYLDNGGTSTQAKMTELKKEVAA